MKNITTSLNNIENDYEILEIKVNNFLLWPYLRYFAANQMRLKFLKKQIIQDTPFFSRRPS